MANHQFYKWVPSPPCGFFTWFWVHYINTLLPTTIEAEGGGLDTYFSFGSRSRCPLLCLLPHFLKNLETLLFGVRPLLADRTSSSWLFSANSLDQKRVLEGEFWTVPVKGNPPAINGCFAAFFSFSAHGFWADPFLLQNHVAGALLGPPVVPFWRVPLPK